MITPSSDKEKGLEFELDAVFFEIIFGGEFNPVSPPSLTHCLSFTFSSYIFVDMCFTASREIMSR